MRKVMLCSVILLLFGLSVWLFLLPALEGELRLPAAFRPKSAPADAVASVPMIEPKPEPALPHPADGMLESMTLTQKVGQLFFARCPQEGALGEIRSLHPAGYVLFARDFEGETKDSVRARTDEYQEAARIPLLIGVDEEGGTVTRVSRYPAFRRWPFQSPQEVYAEGGMEAFIDDTAEKDQLLLALGINVNLAPVCDIAEKGDYIYRRTLGAVPAQTAEFVRTVVSQMARDGMGAVLKHFPGYGANGDTHKQSITDHRGIQTYQTRDFLPFEAGIDAGAGGVLVSHLIVSAMDDDAPASLSPKVNRILRETLHFDGVIMTDDLSMDAVGGYAQSGEAAVLAVLAGNDLIITSDFPTQHAAVLRAVEAGRLTEAQLDTHIRRVLDWKAALGLIFYEDDADVLEGDAA